MINSVPGFNQQSWSQACQMLEHSACSYVLATVLGSAGSTPRSAGSKMVISAENIYDSVGGGHLEFSIIQKSRALLAKEETVQQMEHFPLGAKLGQCCGGSITVLLEVIISQHLRLDIVGAGHVAHALMPIMGQLPLAIRWIDSREDLLPADLPGNVDPVFCEFPVDEIASAHGNTAFLILTHNHQLDFALCEAVLRRADHCWLGVIGSKSKGKNFRRRLRQKGFSERLA